MKESLLLKIDALVAGYEKKRIVDGISLVLKPGEIVAIIGHNGAGKSTLLKAIFGLIPLWSGQVTFNGNDLLRSRPTERLLGGIAYIPQGNRVFSQLTVAENIDVAGGVLKFPPSQQSFKLSAALQAFPALKMRLNDLAGNLSGGEKQMLAMACAFILSPRLFLMDEPSSGLAPKLVTQVFERINILREESTTAFLIVEQKVREVLKISDRVYVLRNGKVSYSGEAGVLRDERLLQSAYL